MSNELPRIKHITITGDGVHITYENHRDAEAAAWLIDADVYDNEGKPITIYHSTCSKCGQVETGLPDDAGIHCRRCGSLMVNGLPGEFDKASWLEEMDAEDAAEGTEPGGEHGETD